MPVTIDTKQDEIKQIETKKRALTGSFLHNIF